MKNIKSALTQQSKPSTPPRPIFFDLKVNEQQNRLSKLLEQNPHIHAIDTYEQQLKEFFTLQHPALHLVPDQKEKEFIPYRDSHYGRFEAWQAGKWVYLPWRATLLHLLEDDSFQQVRTGRNRNLITAVEQKKYYHSTIGVAGLSVGNSIALTIIQTGGGKNMRLADPDTLELTNLNRIRSSVTELTEPKVYLAARQIYELDPYANLTLYPEGITEKNIGEFVEGLDVAVDEMDNLALKIRLRQEAKNRKIPVVMATDNGDSGVLDIERHDLDTKVELFHGRAGKDIAGRILNKKIPLPILGKIISEELLGYNLIEPRMQQSLLAIGKDIPTWPQLGSAALLNGVAVATAVRKIITGQPVIKKRAILSLSSWLMPGYNRPPSVKKRNKATKRFAKEYDANINTFLKKFGKQ